MSPVVREVIPAIASLAEGIGDPLVRNRGTIGGSLANADPAADYPASILGLGATIVTNCREIAGDAFFKGLFETALEPGEIITAVRFPKPRCAAYAKFRHPASRFAIVGAFVAQTLSGVRVAITGAASHVFRVNAFEAALTRSFSADALDGVQPDYGALSSDLHASADYRAHVIGEMVRRAVQDCTETPPSRNA
jgi:carbon-monoxide dehydrogenase medium subunit